MRYVALTSEQAKRINSNKLGYTSGKRNKETGKRPNIVFCSSLDFSIEFGHEVQKEFIEI
tara:strand:- start:647 stop:826 length:180 start_codon:yes stop_codon:yes gene_type:complete